MFHLHDLLAGALACARQKWQKWWYQQKNIPADTWICWLSFKKFITKSTYFYFFQPSSANLIQVIPSCQKKSPVNVGNLYIFNAKSWPFALLPAPRFVGEVQDFMIIPRSSKAARIRAPWDPSIWAMQQGPLVGYIGYKLYRRWQATQSCGGLFHKPSKNKFPMTQPKKLSEGMVYLTTWMA